MAAPPGRIAGKTALVTGAGSGIGRATAELMAAEGAAVVLADVDAAAAERAASEIAGGGFPARGVMLDVRDDAAWQWAMDDVREREGPLHILVNNAGIARTRPVAETSLAEWRDVLAVDLDGVFLGTRAAIQSMSATGGGCIVNVASYAGILPSAGAAAYCAAKAAVRIFSKVAAIECLDGRTGIRVHVVSPSGVKTPVWHDVDFFRELVGVHGGTEEAFAAMAGGVPSQEFFTPEDVARTILYLCSDESSHLTGVEIVMNHGHYG